MNSLFLIKWTNVFILSILALVCVCSSLLPRRESFSWIFIGFVQLSLLPYWSLSLNPWWYWLAFWLRNKHQEGSWRSLSTWTELCSRVKKNISWFFFFHVGVKCQFLWVYSGTIQFLPLQKLPQDCQSSLQVLERSKIFLEHKLMGCCKTQDLHVWWRKGLWESEGSTCGDSSNPSVCFLESQVTWFSQHVALSWPGRVGCFDSACKSLILNELFFFFQNLGLFLKGACFLTHLFVPLGL